MKLSKSELRRLRREERQEERILQKERQTTSQKKSKLMTYAFVALIVIAMGAVFFYQGNTPSTGQAVAVADDDPVRGDPKAPVTIVEFGDYQCPFCRRFFVEVEPQIIEEYVETGKVKLVYRDFPLRSAHPAAQEAAEAANCAGDQGAYWEFHDLAYQRQEQLGLEAYLQWAGELRLDGDQFRSCIDAGTYQSEVDSDFQEGVQAGVTGTPTFFVNGQKIVGPQPFAVFQSAIESFLNEETNG